MESLVVSRFVICGGKLFRGDFVEFNGIGFGNVNGGGVWCGHNVGYELPASGIR